MLEDIKLDQELIDQWLIEKLNTEQVEQKLKEEGLDEGSIYLYLKYYRKIRYAKRQAYGFVLMGIGAFLGLVGCIFTMIGISPGWNDFFMYGLTSFAVLIVMIGLYLVFE